LGSRAAVNHDLEWARWLNWLEKRKTSPTANPSGSPNQSDQNCTDGNLCVKGHMLGKR
jgi:hypothetical protein